MSWQKRAIEEATSKTIPTNKRAQAVRERVQRIEASHERLWVTVTPEPVPLTDADWDKMQVPALTDAQWDAIHGRTP